MTTLVIDANVAIKWVIEERHSEEARALLADSIARQERIIGPSLLPAEVLNAIYQNERRGVLTKAEADSGLAGFLALPVELAMPANVFERSLAFARRYGLSATYDAHYLAIANWLNADLWTADEKLVAAVSASDPKVHWIGDYR